LTNKLKRRLLWLLAAAVVVATAILLWVWRAYPPMPEALAALESDTQVAVESGQWLMFRPSDQPTEVGLIIYPGALIDPRGYAPTARGIAAQGYTVVIVPMPLKLAVLGIGRATGVMEALGEVRHWAIGGHSLGGAMTARFARDNPSLVKGLVLWAAYPSSSDDLSASDLKVVSVYGTRDGLTSLQEIERSRQLLPPDTQFAAIEGGNHAQFGWYGAQPGDNEAAISREAQQAQVVEATVRLLRALQSP
jgi:pimeloyl-ACP methyl ester carboxylesterase